MSALVHPPRFRSDASLGSSDSRHVGNYPSAHFNPLQLLDPKREDLQNEITPLERFVRGLPEPPRLAGEVWINPPRPATGPGH